MTSEDWAALAAVGALIAGVAAAVALYFSWRSAQQAGRAARAAEEQTEIQRQLRKDAAQPYVWADIRLDDDTGGLLNVVVGNSGPTIAQKVRVKFDPPLPVGNGAANSVKSAQAVLTDGIESLPPGRVMQWYLGVAPELLGNKDLRSRTRSRSPVKVRSEPFLR